MREPRRAVDPCIERAADTTIGALTARTRIPGQRLLVIHRAVGIGRLDVSALTLIMLSW